MTLWRPSFIEVRLECDADAAAGPPTWVPLRLKNFLTELLLKSGTLVAPGANRAGLRQGYFRVYDSLLYNVSPVQ